MSVILALQYRRMFSIPVTNIENQDIRDFFNPDKSQQRDLGPAEEATSSSTPNEVLKSNSQSQILWAGQLASQPAQSRALGLPLDDENICANKDIRCCTSDEKYMYCKTNERWDHSISDIKINYETI